MLWVAVDVALAVLALGVLVSVALRLWRALGTLWRAVGVAGAAVGAASDQLAAAQARAPQRREHPA